MPRGVISLVLLMPMTMKHPKVNWARNQRLLFNGSKKAIQKFLAARQGLDLCAIGYTFELSNASPAFDLVANTRAHFQKHVKESLAKGYPGVTEEGLRWNSGDYEFCAGILGENDEMGKMWAHESAKLHKLSRSDDFTIIALVYEGIVSIACETLAELALAGVLGDWKKLDFNVAEYCDKIEVIKQRDKEIRKLIRRKNAVAKR